eukprot:SAG31_NODE_4635_length_3081_cov_2.484574_3_plen_129_part_00
MSYTLEDIKLQRCSFVAEGTVDLEASHPEVVQAIVAKLSAMFPTDEDGTLRTRYDKPFWKPHEPTFLRTYDDFCFPFPTPASVMFVGADGFASLSKPFISEVPQPFLDVIAAAPTSAIAESCESIIGR